jgi:hypothetical protein
MNDKEPFGALKCICTLHYREKTQMNLAGESRIKSIT